MALVHLLALLLPCSSFEVPALAAGACGQNKFYKWRGYRTRYVALNEDAPADAPTLLLVHGLFVNADHWRKNLPALAASGCRVFAVDLLGCGYSDKPAPSDADARAASGEKDRPQSVTVGDLGTAGGKTRSNIAVDQLHPVNGSPYNFFTWAEQLRDFSKDVMGCSAERPATLVCNSIGTISGLQAAVDEPALFSGVLAVAPNFRELHAAEQPSFLRPVVAAVQSALRSNGAPLFDALATPSTVRAILESQPYYDKSAVTEELVECLLRPLLTAGSSAIVFDTLSYSAGPLPEQLLQDPRLAKTPVWVCYGDKDPWTPGARVEALSRFGPVQKVVTLPNCGHCPHDEAPDLVNPLILDFVKHLQESKAQ
ncbi:Alpha/Beta hydrolase protein [Pelagophyceae sp. CCMP2097]|nr:Alpha/Beta hydrolase protein [Pelagophyceae sp. CCMP2097]